MSQRWTKRILIVDDQRETGRMLRTGLEMLERGYAVVDVPSGEEALLELRRQPFDLVVCDYLLPGISGPELVRRARGRQADLRFLVITGQDLNHVQAEFEGLGVLGIFEKPIDLDRFVETVSALLDGGAETAFQPVPPQEGEIGPSPAGEARISRLLSALLADLGAHTVAFTSRGGRVVSQQGRPDASLPFEDLVAFLTANFVTTTRLSVHLGGGLTRALHYYGGSRYDIYTLAVNDHFFLIILFPGGSQKQIGAVLRYGQRAVLQLRALLEREAPARSEEARQAGTESADAPADAGDGPLAESALAAAPEAATAADMDTGGGDGAEAEVPVLELDLESLEADLEAFDDLDSFWEDAGTDRDVLSEEALSMDEAIELGLFTDGTEDAGGEDED